MASNGWELKTIEELKAPTNGAISIGPFGSRMKSDCYVPSGVPVIRGTNISDTRALIGEMVCITPKLADQLGNAISSRRRPCFSSSRFDWLGWNRPAQQYRTLRTFQ